MTAALLLTLAALCALLGMGWLGIGLVALAVVAVSPRLQDWIFGPKGGDRP